MQQEKSFRLWDEDCLGYVKKADHGGWHIWDELLERLKEEFGYPFVVVPWRRRGDWMKTLWFHPKDTPRSEDDWVCQAQLYFARSVELQQISFGLIVESMSTEKVEQEGYTPDRDGHRFKALLEDEDFRDQIDRLVAQEDLQIALTVWEVREETLPSAKAILDALRELPDDQGWRVELCKKMPCADAVALGEEFMQRVVETYRAVWPIFLEVLAPGVRETLSEAKRRAVLIGASARKRLENDPWLIRAQRMIQETGKAASWWSYNPDPEYIALLRDSLPTWLYVSYGGEIVQRRRVVDVAAAGGEPLPSPWPEHTAPEDRGKTKFFLEATGKEHDAKIWLLLDRVEPVDPPLTVEDFEPVGKKYQRPGQNHFAFVYGPVEGRGAAEKSLTHPSHPIAPLSAYLSAHGFHFPDDLLTTYYLSLQTKPFVILSGLSGTGKTKLAQLFAEFISSPAEREIEETEVVADHDTFVLTVRPYMQKYARIVIPVDAWNYFPDLDPGEKARVRVRVGNQEEKCLLSRWVHPQASSGYLELLFRGAIRAWIRDEVEVGDAIEVQRSGSEEEPVYTLRRGGGVRRRVTVRETRVVLVPVRPDWTDPRGLLGFHHILTGMYHTTDFLRLILAAYADPDRRPYFAILDEMNLARVEYYFADFLSMLESRRLGANGKVHQDPFALHNQPRCLLTSGNEALVEGFYDVESDHKTCTVTCEGCPFQHLVDGRYHRGEYGYEEARRGGFDPLCFVPPRLEVPLNVYFTGTVNMDETTFTFSPKVLDRANVIEFGDVDLERYWKEVGGEGNAHSADEAIVRVFTHNFSYPFTIGLRNQARSDPGLASYRKQLASLVRLLSPFHMHFAYRVADEILVYLLNARELGDPGFSLDTAFDHAVLQKILPRFHGSRARLWHPLLRLLAFCSGDPSDAETRATSWENYTVAQIEYELEEAPRLPRSAAKSMRMLHDLEDEGFTSFA